MPLLKYQSLIAGLSLSSPCPNKCLPIDSKAFRWVKETFDDGQSFLPNYIYDQNRGKKPRKNDPSDDVKCEMCALSFFVTIQSAKDNAEAMGGPKKVTKLLGYTHLAEGDLFKADGIGSDVDNSGHFVFFEYLGVTLETKFGIREPL